MAPKTVYKTLYYLRAVDDYQPVDLEQLVVSSRNVLPNVADTEITLATEDVLRVQHYKQSEHTDESTLLHIVKYTPGERAPTLQPSWQQPEDHEGAHPAPTGREFKDGDSFLLINGNHALFCSHGISLQKTELYLKKLFEAADISAESRRFELKPASDLDKLALLQTSGVRSISLGTTAFQVSIPQAQRTTWISRMVGYMGDELSALASEDDSAAAQRALEDMLINVELKLDGNTRAQAEAQDFIVQAAESVLDDTDAPINDFSICTQSGERITPATVRLQTRVGVLKQDRSINHESVWEGMVQYLGEMRTGNLLEQ